MPIGVIGRLTFDRAGRRLGFTMSTADSTGDVYVVDLADAQAGALDRERGRRPRAARLRRTRARRYPSFDGARSRPGSTSPRRRPREPLPVIINIHGGPEAQTHGGFSAQTQYWVNELGVAVIVPNVRGSSGYGKSYLLLDNGERREDSVKDIGALLDWIGTQPDLDAARVAVIGGSYGGYMVLASLVHYATGSRCGVDVVGISNFVTFLERTEAYRRDLRRAEYGDERDPRCGRSCCSISPLTQRGQDQGARCSSAQGQNDPRVPAERGRADRRHACGSRQTVWYVLATDEGHGFQKKPNRDYLLRATSSVLRAALVALIDDEFD